MHDNNAIVRIQMVDYDRGLSDMEALKESAQRVQNILAEMGYSNQVSFSI
ncbi:hypothetical protein [Paenibacillus solani]|nr:hypothetical protein [Paenibacillus solani]